MKTENPMIRLRRATVRRGGKTILGCVDFALRRGEHVAVLGGNGAGKSTLLSLCRGDLPPTEGERVYDFGTGPQISPIGLRERMGLVSAALHDKYACSDWRISVEEAVASAFQDSWLCYNPPLEKERAEARAMLDDLGIADLADLPVSGLSTGQLRAVLLARALVTRPEVLFLDECLDGLDAAARELIMKLMNRAAGRCTLVCAVHHQADIPAPVRRALLLREGSVVASGALDEVAAHRRDHEVGECLGDLPAPPPLDVPYIFRLENVSVVFAGRKALDGLDWTVRPGENWAVLGGNGAGKSTLLRVLLGLEDVYPGGRLGWFGVDDLPDLTEVRRTVGYVSPLLQGSYSYDLLVRETVWSGFFGSVGLYDQPDEEQKERAELYLRFFGLDRLADRRIRSLSYGQLRRVLLARAAVSGPALLLLDEPLSGLDRRARPKVLGLLERLAATGTHFVYVTHHVEELFPAIDHVLHLEQGRAAYCGLREDLRA
jgi:molybdate transport system ATP-binding protein